MIIEIKDNPKEVKISELRPGDFFYYDERVLGQIVNTPSYSRIEITTEEYGVIPYMNLNTGEVLGAKSYLIVTPVAVEKITGRLK